MMPRWEIETPDGRFEVEAPDEQSALDALRPETAKPLSAPQEANELGNTAMITGAGLAKGLRSGLDPRGPAVIGMSLFPGLSDALKSVGAPQAVMGLKSADPINIARGLPGVGQFVPSQPLAETYSDPNKTAKAVGAEMTPLRRSLASGAEVLGASLPMMVTPAMAAAGLTSAAGAGVGEALGGETGKTAGALVGALVAPMMVRRPSLPKPPTAEALKDQAQQAYKAAEQAGVVIAPESFNRAIIGIARDAAKQGMHPKLHPRATAALESLSAEMERPLTLERAEVLRRVLKSAASSADASERRLVMRMTDRLDDFIANLKPTDVMAGEAKAATDALSNARSLWSRARKSEVIEELMERARTRASQFSGSGYENALRTEFRNFVMNPRKMRMFSGEEQAAIRKVAKGGPMENLLRMVGKFAPTGVVSSALSSGIGFATGGMAGAAALPALGFAARNRATALTQRNARLAAEMMRRGTNLSPRSRRLLERYLQAAGVSASGIERESRGR